MSSHFITTLGGIPLESAVHINVRRPQWVPTSSYLGLTTSTRLVPS